MMKKALIALLAFTIFLSPSVAQEPLRPVKLMTISSENTPLERVFFGQVIARQTVDLAFQVAGQINQFDAIEGASIPKNGLIAQLDLEPFELKLAQAKLQHDQAERGLARFKTLGSSTVSQVSIDDAQTALSLAKIALRNAQYALEHATLFAPFDGLVSTRHVANFTTIAAGTPIVRVHDMSEVRVEIDVPEILFRQATSNPNFSIYATLPGSEEKYPLSIREHTAETSAIGQTYRLTLAMQSDANARVLPGSSVTVVARALNNQTEIFLPATALRIAPDQSLSVMVFEPKGANIGTVRQVPVTVKPYDDGRFVLLSGVADGSEIVSTGVDFLADGQEVSRFAGFAN